MNYSMLHTHSVYSIKDSISTCDEYVRHIQKLNKNSEHKITSLAITEHGNLFSLVKLHNACKGTDIKPIYGVEMYHVIEDEHLQTYKSSNVFHLVLLAKNQTGLKNIIQISSHGGNHAKSHRFITSMNFMKDFGEGIICSTACFGGRVAQLLYNNKYEEAKQFVLQLKGIFDEVYLEIQPHSKFPSQVIVNEKIKQLSEDTGVPIILTTDTHYVLKEDKQYRDLLSYTKKDDDNDEEDSLCDLHVHSVEELIEFCDEFGFGYDVITRTNEIAEKCNVSIELENATGLMPSYPCPKGYNENSYLIKLANEGLLYRLSISKNIQDNVQEYFTRLNYELDVITQMGFSGYFLILWDWFKWCKDNGILLGPGRGSAAGSIVAYVLDITKIDPIKNGLIFERFLNIERIEAPDIDTDVSRLDRPRALQYLKDKYGSDRVCQIVTFGKYKVKSTIKALLSSKRGFTQDFQNQVTKGIPDLINGSEASFELLEYIAKRETNEIEANAKYEGIYAGSTEKDISSACRAYASLVELFKDHPEVEHGLKKFKNVIASLGIHAGGVVVSSKRIQDYIPLMKGSDTAVLNVCQADMSDITFYGMLKIDALGLKTLSQIDLCLKLANIDRKWLDIEDTDDKKVYKFLRDGNTFNVFQMQKRTPTVMIKDFKVKDLEGLTAVNAGNRPGPLAKGTNGKSMVDTYIENANGNNKPSYDPRIDPILESTNMCIWYQEHCIKLGMTMAGYSLGNSDLRIRKVLGKKLVKKIPEIRNEFVYGRKSIFDEEGTVIGVSDEKSPYCIGAINNGFSEELALEIFSIMEEFAKYSFNKSHKLNCGLMW